jgi:hypothetical protein
MSLWRSTSKETRTSRSLRSSIERLDDRIVPNTTATNPPVLPPTDPTITGTTPTGTSSQSQTPDGTTTTTTTNPNGTTTTTVDVPPTAARREYAVVTDAGRVARVRVYNADGTLKKEITPYTRDNFRGGARVALGDINGDGIADIVTGPGGGYRPYVKVFDGLTGQEILGFDAYDTNFRGGVNVAVADMDGDGRADIITGAGEGGGSHVKIFSGKGLFPEFGLPNVQVAPGPNSHLLGEFFAYDAQYLVGARIAVGDFNGDGRNEIVTAPGQNGGPHIRTFNTDGTIYREWFAYDSLYRGGVFVAAGDLNGDGRADVITGMGNNGITQVKTFDVQSTRSFRSFIADSATSRVSVRVGVVDYDGDGDLDILTAVKNKVTAWDGKTYVRLGGLMPFDPSYTGGVFFG